MNAKEAFHYLPQYCLRPPLFRLWQERVGRRFGLFICLAILAIAIAIMPALSLVRRAALAAQSSNIWTERNDNLTVNDIMVVAPDNPNVLYALSSSLLMKSTDGGANWRAVNLDLSTSTYPVIGVTNGLVINPGNPNVIYFGSDDNFTPVIYKSVDQGQTWRQYRNGFKRFITDTFTTGHAVDLAIDPNNSNVIYAATMGQGLYKSVDGGANWTSILTVGQLDEVTAVAVVPANSNIVYAGISSGTITKIYKSTNGGSTWNSMLLGTPTTTHVKRLKVEPGNSNVVYALNISEGLFKSENSGSTWTLISPNRLNCCWGDFVLDPANPSTIYINRLSEVFRSTNSGATWSDFSAGLSPPGFTRIINFEALTISASGQTLYGGGIGVFRYQYGGASCTFGCSATAPASGTVNTPVAYTASATATGCSGAPSYDWDFGDNTSRSSQQNPTHVYSTAGVYTWRMTASIAGASACAKTGIITIGTACTPPSITTQPSSQTINSGQTATLNVVAQGATPLSYQWYRGQSGDTSNPVSGATGSGFTTPSLNNTTSYWVRVSNNCGPTSRADSLTATVTVQIRLEIELIDPACNSSGAGETCPGTYLVGPPSGVGLVDDINRLAQANVKRDGAATDGVTLLLLRVRSETSATLTLKRDNGGIAGPEWGTLRTRATGSPTGQAITVIPETTNAGKIAFAVYQAPVDFPDESSLATSVTVEATAGSSIVRQVIVLRRPPIVLVHGVWSDGGAWQALEGYLESRGFDVCDECRVDYSASSAGSFDPAKFSTEDDRFVIERLVTATRKARESLRGAQFAVTQIDIVGHSMGGLVARARVSYKNPDSPYLRKDNYHRGDFHKIITVGTPHRGSPLADFLLTHRCQTTAYGLDGIKLVKIRLEDWFAASKRPLGPAIYGFQLASAAIKNIGETRVPSHAIVGLEPGEPGSVTEKTLNIIIRPLGGGGVDDILLGELNHDTIVPRLSQQGGLTGRAVSPPAANVVHADLSKLNKSVVGCNTCINDVGETASEDVWLRVLEALRSPTNSDKFGYFSAFNPIGPEIQYAPCDDSFRGAQYQPLSRASLTGDASANSQLSITLLPSSGTVVHPGDVVSVTFTVSGGNETSGALFSIGGGFYNIEGPGPYSFSYRVSSETIGKLDISALTYGAGPDNYFGISTLTVTLSSPTLALSASPSNLRLEHVGERFQLRVIGQLSNQTAVDLSSRFAGTTYSLQSGSNAIISVSPDGLVEARGAGQEAIMVTNSGKTAMVSVVVNVENPAPSITGLQPNSISVGGAAFDLVINGANFSGDSAVYWNGSPRPTTFVSANRLTATITATDIATASVATVAVYNPGPGGGGATANLSVGGAAVASVSAASFSGAQLASESIVAAFGTNLATSTQVASSIPLPTSLAGTTVKVKDIVGIERLAPLFFVAPSQVNYQIPPGTSSGAATITITGGNGANSLGAAQITAVAPGLFSADATGQGVATGVALRVKADGSQIYEPISRFDQAQNKFVAIPLDLGPVTDRLFLILYGTGIRFRSSLSAVAAKIGGADAEVFYAGLVDGLVGLDQINLSVPRTLAGRGEVDVVITADGKPANTVRVGIGPVTALIPTLTSINPNTATAGSSAFTLTVNGTNFVNGSVVRWNGNERATTFVNSTQLRCAITAGDIVNAGTASIAVLNPNGGSVSNSLPFSITQACAYSISPASQSFSALGGSGSVNVTATSGCNWTASSNASWITINSGGGGSGNGTVTFSVAANPNPAERTGMLTIAFQNFTVTQAGASNPAPAITSLSPNLVTAAGPAFSLTINGTGFVLGSVVRWNGNNRMTTFSSNTQLRADIPASDIVSVGTAAITIFSPAPGGGISNALNLTITPSNQGSGPFAGGTFFDRDGGVIGTAFLFNPVTPSGTIPYIDIQGPAGWNSNNQFRVPRSQLTGMAAERSMGWAFTQPVTGTYSAIGSAGGQRYESQASINAAGTLPAPQITNLSVTPGQVTFTWTASSAAQSFLVRVNPLPFAGTITSEIIVPGSSRTATLSGVSLASGATYQAIVLAFSLDVKTPGAIAGPFNVSTHSISFTAPTTINVTWRRSAIWTGTQSGPTDAAGRAWNHPAFDDSQWGIVALPDSASSDNIVPNDRYYRAHFNWDGSSPVRANFSADDGLAIFVNGTLLGSWGGYRQFGCVNGPPACTINTIVPPQTIPANLMRVGDNVITVDAWNAGLGFSLNVTLDR